MNDAGVRGATGQDGNIDKRVPASRGGNLRAGASHPSGLANGTIRKSVPAQSQDNDIRSPEAPLVAATLGMLLSTLVLRVNIVSGQIRTGNFPIALYDGAVG